MYLIVIFLSTVVGNEVQNHVRLVGGISWGRVEIYHNGTWGTICSKTWSNVEAKVVCRMLGYRRGESEGNNYRRDDGQRSWLSGVKCNGDEYSLYNCKHNGYGAGNCRRYQNAGVRCYSSFQNHVRLVGGISWGRVEIYHNGTWGTICSKTWSNVEARVVCRMLGYRRGEIAGTKYRRGHSQRSWLSGVKCNGDEYSLYSCKHSGYGADNCTRNQNVGVRCYYSEYMKSHLLTRLNLSPKPYEGQVEVQIGGVWGGICDEGWNDVNAKVICRSLGIETYYAMAVPKSGYAADNVIFPVWLWNVICNGSESNIGLCQYKMWDQTKCPSNKIAGVICYKTVHDYLRLSDGNSSREGRVEFYYRGQWGAFCDRWDDNNAQVVCRTLGLRGGIGLKNGVRGPGIYGNGNGKFWSQWIECKGNETKITDCPNNIKSFKDGWCGNKGALSVRCLTDIRNATIRLLNGPNPRQGMIEVNVDGIRGTICDMGHWSFNDAMVACKMSGFNETVIAEPIVDKYSPMVPYPKLLRDVHCGRDLDNFEDCYYKFWKPDMYYSQTCRKFKDLYVGVNCIQNVSDYIRLVGGKFPKEGTVEIFKDGKWGGMCNLKYAFRQWAARTVCKTLGYSGGIPMKVSVYGASNWVSIEKYDCDSATRHIGECFPKGYATVTAYQCHTNQAAVRCIEGDTPKDFPLRLVSGQNNQEGIVELYYDGIWWSISDEDWNINAAKVVCKELGLEGYFAVPVPDVYFGKPDIDAPILFERVRCKGNETGLGACSNVLFTGLSERRSIAAVQCLIGIDVINGTARATVNNKSGIECQISEQQLGFSHEKSGSSNTLHGLLSGFIMYSVIVTVLALVLVFFYTRSKRHTNAQRQSEDPLSEGSRPNGAENLAKCENSTTKISSEATDIKSEDNTRTEL